MNRNWKNRFKDVGFTTVTVLITTILLICIFTVIDKVENNNVDDAGQIKVLLHQKYVDPLTTFDVIYKDGTKGTIKANRIIYGQTDSNIYCIGKEDDTLMILSKITVEDIREKSLKISK